MWASRVTYRFFYVYAMLVGKMVYGPNDVFSAQCTGHRLSLDVLASGSKRCPGIEIGRGTPGLKHWLEKQQEVDMSVVDILKWAWPAHRLGA